MFLLICNNIWLKRSMSRGTFFFILDLLPSWFCFSSSPSLVRENNIYFYKLLFFFKFFPQLRLPSLVISFSRHRFLRFDSNLLYHDTVTEYDISLGRSKNTIHKGFMHVLHCRLVLRKIKENSIRTVNPEESRRHS